MFLPLLGSAALVLAAIFSEMDSVGASELGRRVRMLGVSWAYLGARMNLEPGRLIQISQGAPPTSAESRTLSEYLGIESWKWERYGSNSALEELVHRAGLMGFDASYIAGKLGVPISRGAQILAGQASPDLTEKLWFRDALGIEVDKWSIALPTQDSGVVWLHGSKAVPQLAPGDWLRPSNGEEPVADLAASIALRAALISEALDNREDDIEGYCIDADTRWRDASLVPMRGFTYATLDPYEASPYAGATWGKQDAPGQIYKVALTPGALVLPDEDWVGCFAAEIVEGEGFCDHDNERPRTDEGFKTWLYQLPDLLGPALLAHLRELATRATIDIQDPPFETVALRAPLGRTVIRALLPTPAGRQWLEEGVRRYATKIAHQGPMQIVGTVPVRPIHEKPQLDPTWRWTKTDPLPAVPRDPEVQGVTALSPGLGAGVGEPWLHGVEDLWAENSDTPWGQGGLTPSVVARAIRQGRDLDGYDYDSVRYWMKRLTPYVDRPGELPNDDWITLDIGADTIYDGFHRMTAAWLLDMDLFPVSETDQWHRDDDRSDWDDDDGDDDDDDGPSSLGPLSEDAHLVLKWASEGPIGRMIWEEVQDTDSNGPLEYFTFAHGFSPLSYLRERIEQQHGRAALNSWLETKNQQQERPWDDRVNLLHGFYDGSVMRHADGRPPMGDATIVEVLSPGLGLYRVSPLFNAVVRAVED